jgi:FkbM family methyltransferase
MKLLIDSILEFQSGQTTKAEFIRMMYEDHHACLFDYASYIKRTNIKKIEIEDDKVIMTSRNRGARIECSLKDYRSTPIEILNFFDYEKNDSEMIEKLVNEGDTFFDIGSNYGWYSINIALARRESKIFCFEPLPTTYSTLIGNIKLNSSHNITAHNFGFSNKRGEFTFYYNSEGTGNASLANLTERCDSAKVRCMVRTLDDYTEETGCKVDFIKCDVEGAELMVFEGGERTIRRDHPIVFCEILRKWAAKFNYNPTQIFELFWKLGYQAFTVKDERFVDVITIDHKTVETNFFFLHSEKHAGIISKYT